MKNNLLAVLILLLLPVLVKAQFQKCYTMENLEKLKTENPEISQSMANIESKLRKIINAADEDQVFIIPVVIHVLWNTDEQNISDEQVLSQIRVLNEDYRKMLGTNGHNDDPVGANTNIIFRLASIDPDGNPTTGITRTKTDIASFGSDQQIKYTSGGGHDIWDSSKYLNLWVCYLGGFLGYAQFPGGPPETDGVVITYKTFGYNSDDLNYNLGRTTTHEVGHWLNLIHIWGDGGCDASDFVDDTPDSDQPNYGCSVGVIHCGSVDMVENYMDYSDDSCMNIFTRGQMERMNALNLSERASLFEHQPFNTIDNKIKISESGVNGKSQILIFGWDPGATEEIEWQFGEVEMAPQIESGYFDARFILPSDTAASLMDIRSANQESVTWQIVFQSPNNAFPLKFEWDSSKFKSSEFFLQNPVENSTIDMALQSNYEVNNNSISSLLIIRKNALEPIKLNSFTADVSGPYITLSWETASEINNSGFEIERCSILKNKRSEWEELGFVEGSGTTAEEKTYSFNDNLAILQADSVKYRLKQINYDGTFTYSKEIGAPVLPGVFILKQNYPNPFNASTIIEFTLPADCIVKLELFNTIGQKVAVLLNESMSAGSHQIPFNALRLSSGVYFYELSASPDANIDPAVFHELKKMMLIK